MIQKTIQKIAVVNITSGEARRVTFFNKPGIQGPPGKNATPPTAAELTDLILPHIPKPIPGHTPSDEELLALIRPLIPKVKNGESPSDAHLLSLIRPLIPEVKDGAPGQPGPKGDRGSPDSGKEIVEKINASKEKIELSRIKDIDTLGVGHSSYTAVKSATYSLWTPVLTDVDPFWQVPEGIQLVSVRATILGGTSVTFNLQKREKNASNSTGVTIMNSSMVATQAGAFTTTFTHPRLPKDSFLTLVASAVSGSVTKLMLQIVYTI